MDNQINVNKIVKFFFTIQLSIKQYHWTTSSYARHKASDNFLEKLGSNIDKFIEVFIGRYNVKPNVSSINLNKQFFTDDGNMKLLLDARIYLESLNNIITDNELLNIRDEMVADINQTIYLYNLK